MTPENPPWYLVLLAVYCLAALIWFLSYMVAWVDSITPEAKTRNARLALKAPIGPIIGAVMFCKVVPQIAKELLHDARGKKT
jgi:hypothetical protein